MTLAGVGIALIGAAVLVGLFTEHHDGTATLLTGAGALALLVAGVVLTGVITV